MVRSSIHPPLNDADLTTRIGIAFATRPRITWHNILVTVREGIVTLRGEVPTFYDRHLVVAVTRHVAGVFGIDDQITVVEAAARSNQAGTIPEAARPDDWRVLSNPRQRGSRGSRFFLRVGITAFAVAMVTLTGCGGSDSNRVTVHPASGAIQFRGQPISGALVSLHSKDGAGTGAPSPRATVGPDGKFALSTYEGQDGAPEGDYVLTVQWYKPIRQGNEVVGGPNVLPQKYALARTSDVKIKIAAGENHLQPIQLR